MSLFEIFFLSVALGIDCLVVSFSQGLLSKNNKIKTSIFLALTMGFFQWLMPFIGYFSINKFASHIEVFSKYIIFLIFFILGVKFIVESFHKKENDIELISLNSLLLIGIATSIDAFFAGISIKLSNTDLLISTLIIGIMAFLLSIFGFWFAAFFQKLPSKFLEITGGLILVLLGIKALFS